MSIKQRNGVYHCDFFTPSGKRIRQSLGTTDKRQAKELHDKLKAEMWRTEKLGEAPVKLFEEACLRWLNEKSHKRSLDSDKSKIGFFLLHFRAVPIGEITNDRIQATLSEMKNRSHRARWEKLRDRLMREGKPIPEYKSKPVAQSTIYSYQAFMRSLLRIAANEWGWLNSVPVVKAKSPRGRRIRWLTKDEARRLLDELPEHFRSVVIFALAMVYAAPISSIWNGHR